MARFILQKDQAGSSKENDPEGCGIGHRKTNCRAWSHPVDKWQGPNKASDGLLARRGADCSDQSAVGRSWNSEPEYSVRTVIRGIIQLSAHLLAWLELSDCVFVSLEPLLDSAETCSLPPNLGTIWRRSVWPEGLVFIKKFTKAQIIAQKRRDNINLILSVLHCLLLVLLSFWHHSWFWTWKQTIARCPILVK